MDKQRISEIAAALASEDLYGLVFRTAIEDYCRWSSLAKNDAVHDGDDVEEGLWDKASDALEKRFIESPENFYELAKNFGPCFVISVFWWRVTTVIDDIVRVTPDNGYAQSPVVRYLVKHIKDCADCAGDVCDEIEWSANLYGGLGQALLDKLACE